MAKKHCIFCKRSDVTKEHIFSAWIGKLLKEMPAWKVGSPGQAGYWHDTHTNDWVTDHPLELTAKLVCAKCNSRWMSDIESTARPTLTRMILGEDGVELDQTTQQAVAAWACLKTLVGHSIRPPHPVTQEWYDHMLANHAPPDGWEVFTTRYTGRYAQLMESSRFELRVGSTRKALPTRAGEKGVLSTILIGQLAIHSRGIFPSILGRAKTTTNIMRLWPGSPLVLLWPPSTEIGDGQGLDSFRRFGFDPASPRSPLPA